MTISTDTVRTRYSGNGVTVAFSTVFEFPANDYVRVIFTDADGTDTEWTRNTQFTLSGAGTGSVGTVTAKTTPSDYTPAAGEYLTIIIDVPFTQTLDGDAIEALPASAVETAYDKIWLALAQLKEQLSRALLSSETGAGGEPVVASWIPVVAVVASGSRRVFEVVGWSGGIGDEPDSGVYLGATGYVTDIADAVDVRGAQGANGSGSGDMLAAQNLNDVSSKPTAFANIKQAATDTATGVVELATNAETVTGADTARATTPAGVKAHVDARLSTVGASGAYADLTGKPSLGTAAALDVGTAASKVVQLTAAGKLPAVDGSLLTGISTGSLILLTSGTVTAAATLDLVLSSYTLSLYRKIIIELTDFIPVTDNVGLLMRLSANAGVSYDSGASNYYTGTAAATSISLTGDGVTGIGNVASEGIDATIEIFNPSSTVLKPKINSRASWYINADTGAGSAFIAALRNAAQKTDAVRALFTSGNIASGKYAVYGLL